MFDSSHPVFRDGGGWTKGDVVLGHPSYGAFPLTQKQLSNNTVYHAFEYYFCFLPLFFIGIPLCLSCIPWNLLASYGKVMKL
jgi:hypothetical protein